MTAPPVWPWPPHTPACGTLRLEVDGQILDLIDAAHYGIVPTDINLGGPTVREVTAALPTRDGNYDTTRLIGPRVVTITGNAVASALGSRQRALDNLSRFTSPRVRPRLVYTLDGDTAPRVIDLRASAWSAPYAIPDRSEFSVSWVAPDPVIYGLERHDQWVGPESILLGRTYDLVFDREYPVVYGGSGIGTIINVGTYQTWPLLRIYGPCDDPAIWWLPPALGAVVFAGLTVALGDYLEIDTFAQTVRLNGLPGAGRFDRLDFARTVWAPLSAGTTVLRFAPVDFIAPCMLQVLWTDAYL